MIQKVVDSITQNTLQNLVSTYNGNKIFLVTGKQSFVKSGVKDFINSNLKSNSYIRFFDFEPNPKYEDVLRGTKLFMDSKCDIIVAIGGGSVIDMAKLINVFAANINIPSLEIIKNSKLISNEGKSLIAIPTTAGTGSEATHFAVVYHDHVKYSVAHPTILPDVAVLNHDFTASQSTYLTACAGLDAISQAIESYWSVTSTEESKVYAKEAISLLIPNLIQAVNSPNEENRKAIMKGAYLAGKAINISKTTAAHAVSYAFTTHHHIPHGHAVFLTLPSFFEYNCKVNEQDINDSRGVNYVINTIGELCKLLKVDTASEGKRFLEEYAKNLGVELSLKKLDIYKYTDRIADNVNTERLKNNPRHVSKLNLLNLLRAK